MSKSKRKIDYVDFQTLLIGLAFIAFIIGIGVGIIAEQNTINNNHLGINYTAEFYAQCFQQHANHTSVVFYTKNSTIIPSCQSGNNIWIDNMYNTNDSSMNLSITAPNHSEGINIYMWSEIINGVNNMK